MKKYLIYPENYDSSQIARLNQVLQFGRNKERLSNYLPIRTPQELLSNRDQLKNSLILFAVHLGKSNLNSMLYEMICNIREDEECLEGCIAGVLVDGSHELYTKETGREIVFTLNRSGATIPGGCFVEATGSLKNYTIQAQNQNLSLMEAYEKNAERLVDHLEQFQFPTSIKPKLLCIHASSHFSSNTYAIWQQVKNQLSDFEIEEFNARNGTIQDCSGCPFQMCKHYSEKGSCFYGGAIVTEAYPAVERCDAIMILAPNYNDALSANLSAFINRLTSLYRKVSFSDKYLFSIIVSGYSGGDIVANQLISALNMNKKFILPGRFAFFETANDPGSVFSNPSLQQDIESFSQKIRSYLIDQS